MVAFNAGLAIQPSPDARAADPPERKPGVLYALNADGTDWHRLFELEGYPTCGSPAVSPDGKTIAFDGWHMAGNQQQGPAKLFAVDIDGTKPRELCTGQMPTWSPDGKFLACSRSTQPYGIWIMTADGKEHKHIRAAWGAQWSPDGKQIAFYEGTKILTYDVASGEFNQVLGGDANPYKQIFWNMSWSPDSTRICFKGAKPDGSEELAIVDAAGAEFGFKVRFTTKTFVPDFAWHPRGDRIVFCMWSAERKRMQLHELDPDFEDPPALTAGQDETRHNNSPCWTPDGKQLILISREH
jgi:Tol biopolymer transport system component